MIKKDFELRAKIKDNKMKLKILLSLNYLEKYFKNCLWEVLVTTFGGGTAGQEKIMTHWVRQSLCLTHMYISTGKIFLLW